METISGCDGEWIVFLRRFIFDLTSMMAAVMMMRAVMKQEMERFIVFRHLATWSSASAGEFQSSRSMHRGPSQLRLETRAS